MGKGRGDDYWRDILESECLVELHGIGGGVLLKARGDMMVELKGGGELRLAGGEGAKGAAGGGLGQHGGGDGGNGGERARLAHCEFDGYQWVFRLRI